jgi:hypothetical protein
VPQLYRHLRGIFSLAEADPEWTLIETPDRTGFRGLTSPVLTKVNCTATNFCHEGFLQWNFATGRNELQDSDIVCFESAGPSQQGLHSAIMLDTTRLNGGFPPNTLFRLKSVRAPGTWVAPGGIKVNQRLLVVTVTYRQATLSARAGLSGKLCGSVMSLQYGSRSTYINGLGDVVDAPVLTLAMEFDRDMEWTDWQGRSYTLRQDWAYVKRRGPRTRPAAPPAAGTRTATGGLRTTFSARSTPLCACGGKRRGRRAASTSCCPRITPFSRAMRC